MQTFKSDILASVATRRDYEIAKNANCDSMLSNLAAFDKRLSNDAVIALLFATSIDANILNRQERNNARFNIYSFAKILVDTSVSTMNHYSKAILRAAIALKKNDLKLTHADAVFACSFDAKHKDNSRAKIMKAAQYAKHVALNTASTQSSSSINSLCALNVLTESRDDANHVCYSISDNAHAVALCEALAKTIRVLRL